MLIQFNNIAGSAYACLNKSIRSLSASATRMASGCKFGDPSDGAGQIGPADLIRRRIAATNGILGGMQNGLGYSATQDEILSNVGDIIARMSELASSAVDPTKDTADRVSLNAEFVALSNEVALEATSCKYNNLALFGTALTIRVGIESTATVSFSSVALGSLTFASMSLTTATAASTALSTLTKRTASLACLRVKSRAHYGRIERTLDATQTYLNSLNQTEAAITNVDFAKETSNFMKEQMIMNAGMAVIAQANQLILNTSRFFNPHYRALNKKPLKGNGNVELEGFFVCLSITNQINKSINALILMQ